MNFNHARSHRPSAPRSRTARPSFFSALALAALGAASGCMLQVEAEAPDVEVTQRDITFQGIPMAGRLGEVSTMQTFSQEHPALDLPAGIDPTIQAVKVELVAKSGITSFDFLSNLRVSMRNAQAGGASVELINYEKAPGAVVGATLTIPSRNPANIFEQWKTDTAVFEVEVAGTLPEQTWSLDASVHFSGKATYKY